ncbi:hypothetical protein HYW55_01970 [Candidatus Gottesmanbacteria bacterium]|nr:hypothetical protein [Candidatus Gottesmanbacteria bacterium]
MPNNHILRTRRNAWGDEHPEKLTSTSTQTIGLRKQLGGLFAPDQFFRPSGEEQKPVLKTSETLVFSYTHQKEDKEIYTETRVILQKLKDQITVLEKSEKSLSHELSKVKVEHLPAKTGIYYLRYLEWLLSLVRQLQIRVSEGRAWLATFSARKKKRLGYWKMYKKHGTMFGLSHERTIATQTG